MKYGAGQNRLDGLQAGRAVAALLVVAFHANVFILPEKFYDGGTAGRPFSMGYAGVEFFFVLSGFIMYYIHARDFSRPDRAWTFLRKRIVRIYPIYWAILGALLVLYAIAPGPEAAHDPVQMVTSMLLWPMPETPIMRVAWSLQHEMLFYLVFVLTILNLRAGTLAMGLWMSGCLIAPLVGWTEYPSGFLLSSYNLLFLFGIGAARMFRQIRPEHLRPLLLAGVSLFLFTGLSELYGLIAWDKALRTWSYGLGAAMATAALAGGAVSPPRLLTFLGDASYSIYLAHLPAMSLLSAVLIKLGAPWGLPPVLFLGLLVALATATACLVYILVERPLIRHLSAARPVLSAPTPGA